MAQLIQENSIVHPNDHVNYGQSTNDVVPTAGKMTALVLLQDLKQSLAYLKNTFDEKAAEFDSIIKMGRTHLQDAVPIRLGQEFSAYATAIERNLTELSRQRQSYIPSTWVLLPLTLD